MNLYDYYLNKSNLPSIYKQDIKLIPEENDLESFTKLKELNVSSFVSKGNSLFIYSKSTGNGKTTWSSKLMKSYLNELSSNNIYYDYAPTFFINVAELLNLKKNSMDDNDSKAQLRKIESCMLKSKLVVWDDVAVKGLSEFDKEYLYTFVNNRVSNGQSNVYTANITPEEVEEILGARLYSRIVNLSTLIKFVGGDRRGANA